MRSKKRILALFVLLAVGFVLFKVYFPVLSRYHELKIEEDSNDRTVRDLEARIQLKEEKRLLEDDPEYIETTIRKELGMVKPGEIVYKFVEDETMSPTKEPAA